MTMRWMQKTLLAGGCATLALSAIAQQQSVPADPYQGVAHPPSEAILTNESAPEPQTAPQTTPQAAQKPSAAHGAPIAAPAVAAPAVLSAPAPSSTDPATTFPAADAHVAAKPAADPDGDIVHPENDPAPVEEMAAKSAAAPVLAARPAAPDSAGTASADPVSADPDGDIVHPSVARAGELAEGTMFQMELTDRLSSADNEKGDRFHGKITADVMQNGKVLIPAGSTIEGRISAVSSGHLAGHGSLRLTPQTLILPDSTRVALSAEVSGTPGTNNRIDDEGGIGPGSRKERAGIEYGAVAGAGAATGAVFAGPVGALTGGLIGAGMVTTHLMVSHPQTTLEPGTKILFTLTEPLNMMPRTAQ